MVPGHNKAGEHIPRGKNKVSRKTLLARCEELGYDPEQAVVEIATGEMTCLTCFGRCQTEYAIVDLAGERMRDADGCVIWNTRKCESCAGTGRERMHVADVLKARISIFDKIVPSLKQVDHTSSDGSSQRGEMRVVMFGIDPKGLKPRVDIPPQIQQKHD